MRTFALPRLAYLCSLLLASWFSLGAQAQEVALDTTYASGNGQAGNMFDVLAFEDVLVTRLDTHLDVGTWEVEIYTTPGGYPGKAGSPGDWTLLGSVTVTGLGDVSTGGAKTPIPLALNVPIAAGDKAGFYVTVTSGSGINYTNGISEGVIFAQDGAVAILEGLGNAYPFGLFFSARVWNGTLYYDRDCNGNGQPDGVELAGDPDVDIDADGQLDECVAPLLMADVYELSVATGGTQTFQLTSPQLGDLYLLLGSASGTSPGMASGPFTVPLNMDPYLQYTLIHPNQFPLTDSFGTLLGTVADPLGHATASFQLRRQYAPALVGLVAHHAYVTLDPATGGCTSTSNAVPVVFLP